MILLGLDDTDTLDSRGTNQLAKELVEILSDHWFCDRIVRHQLLDDPRVPYTSKNGSASIWLQPKDEPAETLELLFERCQSFLLDQFIEGSDPGLALLSGPCPEAIVDWGQQCKTELVTQEMARDLAEEFYIPLRGLGGTEDGVIGALAALGLAETGNDGRVVFWQNDDSVSGQLSVAALNKMGVRVHDHRNEIDIREGTVDVGKKLRPNLRDGGPVLFVEQFGIEWRGLKLP